MTQKARVIHLLLFLSILVSLNFWITGSLAIQSGDSAIWLHGGLLMLVVGVYWIEPYFTRPADVVINSLVVFVSISTLNNPPFGFWWDVFRYGSALLLILAFVSIIFGVPGRRRAEESRYVRFAYDLATRIGSAKVLFSAVFILALISYFDLNDSRTRWFALFWLVVVLANELRIPELIERLFSKKDDHAEKYMGRISRFLEPNIVRFVLPENITCAKGDVVGFTKDGTLTSDCPLAYVVNHRRASDSLEAEAIIISTNFAEGAIDERTFAVSVDTTNPQIESRLNQSKIFLWRNKKIGFAKDGSHVGRLKFELVNDINLEEGHLVCLYARDSLVYYQVADAELTEESTIEGSKRVFTVVGAAQLGTWNEAERCFEPYNWVPPESAAVYTVASDASPEQRNTGFVQTIGRVPNSEFPVEVKLDDLALYHSAILGVTGTGKSFLAFDLVERLANAGTKVLCLDVTGDYGRHIHSALLIRTADDIGPFLSDAKAPNVGIIEFSEASHPIVATLAIAKKSKEWCEANRTDADVIQPTPKVLLVLEEAHTLVPEWNFNPERQHQNAVSQTAQVVLQARKYGLGFCVITQRTANVTKSILNQCNTIFSFQAFDETGFDFLANYMGRSYVRALPNLQERHGVFVGKASKSPKPLIVRFNDQDRVLREAPITPWQQPDEVQGND